MTAQNSWLFSDGYAVLRAAWTAMDQTYGATAPGIPLSWTDDAADAEDPARISAWAVPPNWTISASIDGPLNGKFVVYENSSSHQVMIVAMGSNGSVRADAPGWLSNIETTGLGQWDSEDLQRRVFLAAERAMGDVTGQQLIVAGDSKGGALAQYIVDSLEFYKNDSDPSNPLARDPLLASLSNSDIGLVARVSPGVSQQLGAGFAFNSPVYDGIQAFYSATEMQDGSQSELISKLGGNYLEGVNPDGTSNFYVHSDGVVPSDSDKSRNFFGISPFTGYLYLYLYLHRLAFSDYDAINSNAGDFSTLISEGATTKSTSLDFSDMQRLGALVSANGQGPEVSTPEALARMAAQVITALATSPIAAMDSVARGSPSYAEITLGLLVAAVPGVEEVLLTIDGYASDAITAINIYHKLADWWNGSSGSRSITPGGETYTATATAEGITLQGSGGDSITATRNGDTTNITLANGDTLTATSANDGLGFSNVSWDFGTSQGAQQFNADGTVTTRTTYASGAYALTVDDGRGNVETDYYTSNGNIYSWSWVHADGSTGSETQFNTGHTVNADGTLINQADYSTETTPDGRYLIASADADTITNSKTYNSSGNVISQTTNVNGGGHNFDTSNTTSQTSTLADGVTLTRVFDSESHLVSDSWTKTDGSSGSDSYNASHAVTGKTTHTDGSSETYSVYPDFYGTPTTFVASSVVSFPIGGPYDATRDQFNSDGALTSDQWQLFDGTTGSDSFASNGAGSGTVLYGDGRHSNVTVGSDGSISIQNIDSSGHQTSLDWWHADGTHGITMQNADGSTEVYAYQVDGTVQETDFAADRSVSYEGTWMAGGLISPDGSQFGKIRNADGTYSINFTDSSSDAQIFKFSGAGVLIGTDHVSEADTSQSSNGFSGTLPDGTQYTVSPPASTA